jgi:hypothetical protein
MAEVLLDDTYLIMHGHEELMKSYSQARDEHWAIGCTHTFHKFFEKKI